MYAVEYAILKKIEELGNRIPTREIKIALKLHDTTLWRYLNKLHRKGKLIREGTTTYALWSLPKGEKSSEPTQI